MSKQLKGFLITLGIFSLFYLLIWTCLTWPEMAMTIVFLLSLAFLFWLMYRFVMLFLDDEKTPKDERIGKKW